MVNSLTKKKGFRIRRPGRVVVEVVGGLGNQMFQYAAARAIADRFGVGISLDLRRYDTDRLRAPALDRWRIDAQPLTSFECFRYPQSLLKVVRRLPLAVQRSVGFYGESTLAFDSIFEALDTPLYLTGYFQSERYFQSIRERLLQEFVPSKPLDPHNAALAMQMSTCMSVSLHVRRGDYVSVPENQIIHGFCSPEYYQRAIATVEATAGKAVFFVFSDDLAWVRRHLPLPATTVFVEGNINRPELDIYLMSKCRHNICANSSFSWWGAWLNAHPEKLVVAPHAWFATPSLDAVDLVPLSWKRVAN